MRRLAMDGHRHHARQLKLTQHAGMQPQPVPSHEDAVCDHAEGGWLHAQSAHLRPRERAALLARAAGHSPTEVALLLGTTVKAVDALTRRARLGLQVILTAVLVLACVGLASTLPGQTARRTGPAQTQAQAGRLAQQPLGTHSAHASRLTRSTRHGVTGHDAPELYA